MKKTYSGLDMTVIRLQERTALLASSDNGSTPSDPSQSDGKPVVFYGTFQ